MAFMLLKLIGQIAQNAALNGSQHPLDAENALWTIPLVRMRSDPRTRIYVDRRTGEGLSTKEILRCLKRYIVRELYPLILSDLAYANRRS